VVTYLGTSLGTSLGTDLAAPGGTVTPPLSDSIIAAMNPRHWYRADTVTLSGANLASMQNRGSAGGQMNLAGGVLAAPSADGVLQGAPSINFTASQWLSSSLPASEYRALHDGTGAEAFVIGCLTGGGVRVPLATRDSSSGAGTHMFVSTAQYGGSVGNGTSLVYNISGTLPDQLNAATYAHMIFKSTEEPKIAIFGKDIPCTTSSNAVSLSSGDPVGTLTIGAQVGGATPVYMRIADVLIFYRRLTPYERQQVREYIAARYGIPAPVWSAEDRQILQLNPFSWIRADYYATAGGKVTAFLDKVLPGHSMAQGTLAAQVAVPAPDVSFKGRQVAQFAGAQWYDSSLPPAAWSFFHDGSGMEYFVVNAPGTTNGWLLGTITGSSFANGMVCFQTAGVSVFRMQIYDGTAPVFSADTSPVPVPGEPTYLDGSYRHADAVKWQKYLRSTLIGSAGSTNRPPGVGAPGKTLRMGSGQGDTFSTAKIADVIMFKRVLPTAERQLMREYMASAYDIV
jgi:hypothetical protein